MSRNIVVFSDRTGQDGGSRRKQRISNISRCAGFPEARPILRSTSRNGSYFTTPVSAPRTDRKPGCPQSRSEVLPLCYPEPKSGFAKTQ
jgi:hypothetical protein